MITNQSPPNPRNLIGRDAAGYLLDKLIGEGGMGAVYSAYSELLGKRAAVKVLVEELSDDRSVVERFMREAKAAAAIRDLNIIDVYAANRFPEDGRMYLVMPYIEGGSLEQLCRQQGPLPLDVAGAIMLQVCSGLDAVHAVAIVHRDIKPQNILIASDHGRKFFAYIVDFGIAKLLDPHLADRNKLDKLTRTRAVVGTVGYMSPEQARGSQKIDARADIYSMGMVLYRMLLNRTPYEADTLYAFWEKQAKNEPFPRPRELRPDLPQALEDLILQCLQLEPARRPGSVREIAQRLARILPNGEMMLRVLAPRLGADMPIGPAEATLTGTVEASIARWTVDTSRPRASRAPILVAAVFASAAVGAVATVAVTRHARAPDQASGSALVPPAPADATPVAVALAPLTTVSPDAAVTVPVPPDAAIVAAVPIDAGAPIVRHAPAVPVTPRPERSRPPGGGSAEEGVSAGTLIVTMKNRERHAEVYLDGTYAGTTPVKKHPAPGSHHVKLVGNDKEEEMDVTINAGKETAIVRDL